MTGAPPNRQSARVIHVMLFFALLLLATTLALAIGGAPERQAALIAVGATAVSLMVKRQHFGGFEPGVFAVDCVVMVLLTHLACTADRHWPIWTAGLQGYAVMTHFTVWLGAGTLRATYVASQGASAWIIVYIVAIGSIRQWQRSTGRRPIFARWCEIARLGLR